MSCSTCCCCCCCCCPICCLTSHLPRQQSKQKKQLQCQKAKKERGRRSLLLCHSTISIRVIMRKIKALHIICPTSPHLLSPFPSLSAYVSACSSFWLLPQSMSCSVSLTTNCSINYACLSRGKGEAEEGGQPVYRVYSGWPGDASLKCHLHLCGKLITFINNTPSECHRRTMGQAAAACCMLPAVAGSLYKACTFFAAAARSLFAKTKCPN